MLRMLMTTSSPSPWLRRGSPTYAAIAQQTAGRSTIRPSHSKLSSTRLALNNIRPSRQSRAREGTIARALRVLVATVQQAQDVENRLRVDVLPREARFRTLPKACATAHPPSRRRLVHAPTLNRVLRSTVQYRSSRQFKFVMTKDRFVHLSR